MKRGAVKRGKPFPRRDPADTDRLRALVRLAFNATQRVYRVACLGRGRTDMSQKLDDAIAALRRARNRLVLDRVSRSRRQKVGTPGDQLDSLSANMDLMG